MSHASPAANATYFDLHTQGLGYLNRIREVTPSRGKPFLACTIAALNGPTQEPEYRYFDVTVCGTQAQHLVNRCSAAVSAGRKVLIGFRLGDLWTDLFRYSRGEKAGQTGVSLKARLLFISWIKIDGEQVYQARPKSESEDAAASGTQTAEGASTPDSHVAATDSPAVAQSF